MNQSPVVQNSIVGDQFFYVPSFHFDSNKPCYCRSEKPFGKCCGIKETHRQPPNHLHIVKDYLTPTDCKRLIRFANKQKQTPLRVINAKKTKSMRVTQRVIMGRKQEEINNLFQSAIETELHRMAPTKPQWFEPPQLLRYGPGGKYDLHADAEHFDEKTRHFYRFIDRDFSTLIYLNDDYQGGELNFPWLNYDYKPKMGDLVFFPSNHIFSHESRPIISGTKYALVSWGAFKGSPRVRLPRTTFPCA